MRIAILNQFYVPDLSPTAHLAGSLAEHRAAKGDAVRVVASRGGYVEASAETAARRENPRVHRVWTPRLGKKTKLRRLIDYGCFYLGAILRLLTMPRQDVIVTLTTPPFIALAAMAHKLLHPSTKLVLWNMDCYPEVAERTEVIREGGWLSRALRRLNRWLMRRMDRIVCLDTAMAELLNSHYAPPDGALPIEVIPNWERADLFPRDLAPEPWEAIEAHGLNGSFIVLYLGNTGYGHRFETVLDAAEQLEDEGVAFVFVGGGSRSAAIRDSAEAAGLSNIVMHGYVAKQTLPSVLHSAHCALITMRDEMLGVISPSKLHSNLAMGLPIAYVGPAKSNVDDAIATFDCGISLRHGQSAALADYIRRLKRDEAERQALRQRARAAFEQSYCDTARLEAFDRLLDAVKPASA
jgi:glycosyltransferase involved in cell wall biosynthesis